MTWTCGPTCAKIDVPTVVIAAAQDHATPTELVRHIADDLPDSELYVVGDAAHLAVVEAPRTISVILDEHFGDTSLDLLQRPVRLRRAARRGSRRRDERRRRRARPT